MSDYLKLIGQLQFIRDYECKTRAEVKTINDVITILSTSTEPRKKGEWIGKEKYMNSPEYFSWQCSVCGCVLEDPTLDKPYLFCPNCGAKMGGRT